MRACVRAKLLFKPPKTKRKEGQKRGLQMKRGARCSFSVTTLFCQNRIPRVGLRNFFETLKLTKNVKLKATHFFIFTSLDKKKKKKKKKKKRDRKLTVARTERLLLTREHCTQNKTKR
jgi:hypothetical protein